MRECTGIDLVTVAATASDTLHFLGGRRAADRHDRLIPMINLVFLILTFFLVVGTIRMADPLPVDPATAQTEGILDAMHPILYLDAAGLLALGRERLDPVEAVEKIKLLLDQDPDAELQIKADRAVEASIILPLLRRLKEAGITTVRLVTIRRKAR